MSLQGSITDARELLSLLQECENLISGPTGITSQTVKTKTEGAFIGIWQLYTMMRRLSAAMNRMGLPEDLIQAERLMTRLMMLFWAITNTLNLMESTTAMGWIKFGISLIYTTTLAMDIDRQMR